MGSLEADQPALQQRYDELEQQINVSIARDYDAALVQRTQGFEPDECCFCKPLTARTLWDNGFVSQHLPAAVESARVLSSLLESTGVMEK